MVAVGAMTTLALSVLGVQFALVLGVLAGLLELVPFYGPVLAAVPAVGLALTTEGWAQALAVLGAVFVIQQVESNLLLPLVMGRAVKLHPAVIALGILFVGWVLGPLAVFIAVPILVMARVLAQNLWVEGVAKREDPPEEDPPEKDPREEDRGQSVPRDAGARGAASSRDPGRRGRSRRPFSPPLTPGGTSCSPARHALRRARERDREVPISGGAPRTGVRVRRARQEWTTAGVPPRASHGHTGRCPKVVPKPGLAVYRLGHELRGSRRGRKIASGGGAGGLRGRRRRGGLNPLLVKSLRTFAGP